MNDPITYASGKIHIDPLFSQEAAFVAAIALCDDDRSKKRDLCLYLFFMRSPLTTYKNLPDPDRLLAMIRSGRIQNGEWLMSIAGTKEVKAAIGLYESLVLMPSERLRIGMIDRIEKHLASMGNVKDDSDIIDLVKKGNIMHESIEKLEAIVRKDNNKRNRANVKTRIFEIPDRL